MYLFGAVPVQKIGRAAHLRAAHQRVVDQDQPFAADHVVDGDELHVRNQVAAALVLRHERARPGRRVFDEGPRQRDVRAVRIADRVRRARIGQARHAVGGGVVAPGEHVAAVVAHLLHAQPLVRRGGVAVVDPQKGADPRLAERRRDRFVAVRGDEGDLARAEFADAFVTEVEVRKGFEGHAPRVRLFADHHGGASLGVARGIDAVGREQQDGHRPVDHALRVTDALGDGRTAVDQRRRQFGGVDASAAHFQKVRRAPVECLFDQFVGVVDAPDRGDGKIAQVRAHQQGLRLAVRDAADAEGAVHRLEIAFELRAEGCVFNVVDGAVEPVFAVNGHPPAPGAEVRVVVRSEKQVEYAVFFRCNAEKAAQIVCLRKMCFRVRRLSAQTAAARKGTLSV